MPSPKPTRSDRRAADRRRTAVASSSRPKLASHVRMRFDAAREQHVLLRPESVVLLNPTGAAVLGLCDGRHTVAEIVATLQGRYDGVVADEVLRFLDRLATKRCVEMSDG
jgi:pyrroloquinoline quinone biosynthesis protein D